MHSKVDNTSNLLLQLGLSKRSVDDQSGGTLTECTNFITGHFSRLIGIV